MAEDCEVRIVGPASSPGRCGWCREALDALPVWSCESCGASLHAECHADARGCLTLGCAAKAPAIRVRARARRRRRRPVSRPLRAFLQVARVVIAVTMVLLILLALFCLLGVVVVAAVSHPSDPTLILCGVLAGCALICGGLAYADLVVLRKIRAFFEAQR